MEFVGDVTANLDAKMTGPHAPAGYTKHLCLAEEPGAKDFSRPAFCAQFERGIIEQLRAISAC